MIHASSNSIRLVQSLFAVLMVVNAAGCAKRMAPPPAPPPGYPGILGEDTDRLQESLFKGDQAVLSNQDIERILSARIGLTDRHRLVVLGLNPRNAWSQEIADLDAQNSERFLKALGAATQISQVRLMPTLLVPEKRTIPYLREAAARFQADLLLVYTTHLRTFQRDRLIGADQVNADCMAESVLLDVRTGIVIQTARSTEAIAARKSAGDLNFAQTVAKAETEATGKALLKLASAAVDYLRDAEK